MALSKVTCHWWTKLINYWFMTLKAAYEINFSISHSQSKYPKVISKNGDLYYMECTMIFMCWTLLHFRYCWQEKNQKKSPWIHGEKLQFFNSLRWKAEIEFWIWIFGEKSKECLRPCLHVTVPYCSETKWSQLYRNDVSQKIDQ